MLGWDYDRAAFDLQVYPGFGDLEALGGSTQSAGVLRVEAIGPATRARRRSSGELLPRLNNRLTGSGTTIGDPRSRPGG